MIWNFFKKSEKKEKEELVQIVSYPKSGNTWVRGIVTYLLMPEKLKINLNEICIDYHQYGIDGVKNLNAINVSGKKVKFFKSHAGLESKLVPDNVIYIYRHPLAVFISSVNFFYINKNEWFFIDGKVKSADEILDDGEMEFYFNRFLDDAGVHMYSDFMGKLANIFKHYEYWEGKDKICLKYENVFDNGIEEMRPVAYLLNKNNDDIKKALNMSNDRTSFNKGFFWKKKKDTYFEYLTEDMISRFENKYEKELKKMGYL